MVGEGREQLAVLAFGAGRSGQRAFVQPLPAGAEGAVARWNAQPSWFDKFPVQSMVREFHDFPPAARIPLIKVDVRPQVVP